MAGSSGTNVCDAAHALATIATGQMYTGHASDCVRLAIIPTWSTVKLQLQALPGTGYPVPFAFFGCAGDGTGLLDTDYTNVVIKSGMNPGCDYFVQFKGAGTTLKFTYYD